MSRQSDRFEFVSLLQEEFPDRDRRDVLEMAQKFMRYAKTATRYAVMACNEPMTAADEKRDAQNDAHIHALAADWGMTAVLNGDPRGVVVKLKVPSGRTNDWGQTGICVPEGNS